MKNDKCPLIEWMSKFQMGDWWFAVQFSWIENEENKSSREKNALKRPILQTSCEG